MFIGKLFLVVSIGFSGSLALAQSPTFSDVERDPSWNIPIYNPQHEAFEYCASKGLHLPEVRELALLAMTYGAKGISELQNGAPDSSYYLVESINRDGKEDAFYYSNEGYQKPSGDNGNNSYWSASASSYSGAGAYPAFAFMMDGQDGFITTQYSQSGYAVRCVLAP